MANPHQFAFNALMQRNQQSQQQPHYPGMPARPPVGTAPPPPPPTSTYLQAGRPSIPTYGVPMGHSGGMRGRGRGMPMPGMGMGMMPGMPMPMPMPMPMSGMGMSGMPGMGMAMVPRMGMPVPGSAPVIPSSTTPTSVPSTTPTSSRGRGRGGKGQGGRDRDRDSGGRGRGRGRGRGKGHGGGGRGRGGGGRGGAGRVSGDTTQQTDDGQVVIPPSLLSLIPPKYRYAASVGNTPEEIAQWKAERRKNYPTAANVERKVKERREAVERGDTDPTSVPSSGPKHKRRKRDSPAERAVNAAGDAPKRSSLLSALLTNDIKREKSIILQCFRHIVRDNFFQTPAAPTAPTTAAEDTAQPTLTPASEPVVEASPAVHK